MPPAPGPTGLGTEKSEGAMDSDKWTDKVVMAAESLLYDKQSADSLSKSYSSGDPAEAISRAAVSLITSIDDKLGGKIPEESIFPAAVQVMDRSAELREAETGETINNQQMQQASLNLVKGLAQEYGTTPEQAQAFVNEQNQEDVKTATQTFGGMNR